MVSGKWTFPWAAVLTSEDRLHLALLIALCATNAAVLSREPSASGQRASAARAAVAAPAEELSRGELEAAIERLRAWLERARSEALVGSEQELALRGLGPTAEDRSNPERWLTRWLGPEMTHAWLNGSAAAMEHVETRRELSAALVILLEAGVPPSQPVATPAGEQTPGTKLAELVQRVLDVEPPRAELTSPWQLDLLSLAVLGGLRQYHDRLARATQRELVRLDREQRTGELQPGSGDPSPEQLESLARDWRANQAAQPRGAQQLHWSAAVFRATAVLKEEPLSAAARQHQRGLLGRYRSERALYRYLEATARDERERALVQLAALENLGRFEEALYGAQLGFSPSAARAPGAETARVMRMAARELIDRWQGLEANELAARGLLSPRERTQLLRAAVHALRGLRAARVAG